MHVPPLRSRSIRGPRSLHALLGAGALAASVAALPASPASAAEVVVRVAGIAASAGEVGCALFGPGPGFPMDIGAARQLWLKADTGGVTCRFADVPEGTWAVSVSHDLNGNRRADTNLVGMPTEAWGVTRNVRPTLRAPRFDEASFRVDAGATVTFEVTVAR